MYRRTMPACFSNTSKHVLENYAAYTGRTCCMVLPEHASMYLHPYFVDKAQVPPYLGF
jgi:hypothetical protein